MNSIILYSVSAVVIAYLLGSIPTSYIMGKLFRKIDIRQHGSGNVGATNALRILGVKMGITVMIIDILKGYVAVQIGKLILLQWTESDFFNYLLIIIAFGAIMGHIFTVFLNFKGGKGVATSAGVFLSLTPIPFIAALLFFILTVTVSKYVSLGSIIASVVLIISETVINIKSGFAEIEFLILVFLVAFFIIIKHKANIKRLLAGNENKISFTKK